MSWAHPRRDGGTCSYTVDASLEQAERWEAAAAAQGCWSVGKWLAQTADEYLRELTRTGRALPLTWRRGRFRVVFTGNGTRPPEPREEAVLGPVSGCFGIFRGDPGGPGEPACGRMSLVHLPTRRILGTVRHLKACKAFAAELSALRIDWSEADPERVVQGAPDQEKAQALLRLFETLERR